MPRPQRLFSCTSLLSTLLMIPLFPAGALAGGWTQPAGEGYGKIWTTVIAGDQAFLANGELVPSESFYNQSLAYYVEYGLSDAWTFVSTGTPAGWAEYGEQSAAYVGPLSAGLRRALVTAPFALSIEARPGFEPGAGQENLAPADASVVYIPAVDTLRLDWELQAGLPLPFGWASVHVGSRWYSDSAFDPVVTGFAQLGVNLPLDIVADVHLSAHIPIGDTVVTNVAGAGQTEYVGLGLGLSWWFHERTALSLTGEGVAYAKSNAGAPSLSVGLAFR